MSKPYFRNSIINHFEAICSKCDFTRVSTEKGPNFSIHLEIEKTLDNGDVIYFTLILSPIGKTAYFVSKLWVMRVGQEEFPQTHLIGDVALAHRTKRALFQDEKVDKKKPWMWLIYSPSNLETLLEDYAWVAWLDDKEPLFTLLIEYRLPKER